MKQMKFDFSVKIISSKLPSSGQGQPKGSLYNSYYTEM